MSAVRKFLRVKALAYICGGLSLSTGIAFWSLAHSAEVRIDYILRTNMNKVDVHFGTEPNRTYVLQAINSLSCTNGNCNSSGVSSNMWTNLLTVIAAPFPPSNHYIYRDGTTNKGRFYRLRATP